MTERNNSGNATKGGHKSAEHRKEKLVFMKTTAAVQTEQATVTESGVMTRAERMHIYQPKTCFKGGETKWFDDSRLLKSNRKESWGKE